MIRLRIVIFVFIVVVGISRCLAATTLITNATLISPERSEPLLEAWVRIENGVITGVGDGDTDETGHDVINASGRYLIPGLIDSHVHLYHATGLKRRYTDDYGWFHGTGAGGRSCRDCISWISVGPLLERLNAGGS